MLHYGRGLKRSQIIAADGNWNAISRVFRREGIDRGSPEAALGGDAHFIQVGIGRELLQGGNGALPAESSDANRTDALSRILDVGKQERLSPNHATGCSWFGSRQSIEKRVRHRVDQPKTKQWRVS